MTFQNAHEVTEFFLRHRGRCFEGWTASKISDYVLVHAINRNVFAVKSGEEIGLAAIAYSAHAVNIDRAFDWTGFPADGDSIMIADVAGDRKLMPQLLKQVSARWQCPTLKRLFTHRRGKLVELNWNTVCRFSFRKVAHG